MKNSKYQTVMTTNGGYDTILVVDSRDKVLSAMTATSELVAYYLSDGADSSEWEIGQWDGFDGDRTAISDYGVECGRNGQIADDSRREFWTRRIKASNAAGTPNWA